MFLRWVWVCGVVFCQAEDGIRDLVRSRGLGDVYKRQVENAFRGSREAIERGNRDLLNTIRDAAADYPDPRLSLIHI